MVSEVSAVARYGGRFVVFGDELGKVWTCGSLAALGAAVEAPRGFLPAMEDVEAASRDRDGNLWVCTSHSCTKGGDRKAGREMLVLKFADQSQRTQICTDLRKQLLQAPNTPGVLATSETLLPERGGVNIEGVAMVPSPYRDRGEDDMLLVGFRAPLTGGMTGQALFAQVQFPRRLFNGVGSIGLSFWSLDIGGGVRDLFWDERSGRLLVLSGGAVDGGAACVHVVNLLTRGTEKRVGVAKHSEALCREGNRIAVVPDAVGGGTVVGWVEL